MLDLIEIKTAKSGKNNPSESLQADVYRAYLVNLSNTTNLKSMLEIKLLFA